MKYRILLGILPLIFAGLSIANAGDARAFRDEDPVDPNEIAKILSGNTPAPTPVATTSHASGSVGHPRAHTRGIMLDYKAMTSSQGQNSSNDAQSSGYTQSQAPTTATQNVSSAGSFSVPISFASNSASILPESLTKLNAVGTGIKQADVKVVIEGHTDAAGSHKRNLALSKRRADAVKHYLMSQYHIKGSNLLAIGKGDTELLDQANPYAPENRRVVFRASR